MSDAPDPDAAADSDLERLLETSDEPLPPEEPFPGEEEEGSIDEGLLDRLRGTGVGTDDPNIVGDAGPVDIPPGIDPHG